MIFQIRVVFFSMQIEDLLTLWNMKSEGMANKHKTQQCVSRSTARTEQPLKKSEWGKVY